MQLYIYTLVTSEYQQCQTKLAVRVRVIWSTYVGSSAISVCSILGNIQVCILKLKIKHNYPSCVKPCIIKCTILVGGGIWGIPANTGHGAICIVHTPCGTVYVSDRPLSTRQGNSASAVQNNSHPVLPDQTSKKPLLFQINLRGAHIQRLLWYLKNLGLRQSKQRN
jgi:hypothetical protein